MSSFVTTRSSGDSPETFGKHFYCFLFSCICFCSRKLLWGTSLPGKPFYLLKYYTHPTFFFNLDVPRWCMEIWRVSVNFYTNCVIIFFVYLSILKVKFCFFTKNWYFSIALFVAFLFLFVSFSLN